MRLTGREVADAVDGTLAGPDVTVDGASIDSPTLVAGPAVRTRRGRARRPRLHRRRPGRRGRGLPDRSGTGGRDGGAWWPTPSLALWSLGAHARALMPDRVIGITGSVGKTTVKDLVAGGLAVRVRTHATHASYNNELGVPLTLLGAPDGVEAVVVEMGARFPGDIARLCGLVRPAIGVITSIGTAHLEHLGGPERWPPGEGVADRGTAGRPAMPSCTTRTCGPDLRARTDATVVTFGTDTR